MYVVTRQTTSLDAAYKILISYWQKESTSEIMKLFGNAKISKMHQSSLSGLALLSWSPLRAVGSEKWLNN